MNRMVGYHENLRLGMSEAEGEEYDAAVARNAAAEAAKAAAQAETFRRWEAEAPQRARRALEVALEAHKRALAIIAGVAPEAILLGLKAGEWAGKNWSDPQKAPVWAELVTLVGEEKALALSPDTELARSEIVAAAQGRRPVIEDYL